MKQGLSPHKAVEPIENGASIMVGGFMCCGQAITLIDALIDKGVKDLTIICNDAGFPPDRGIDKLIATRQVTRLITSHIGLNPLAGQLMNSGEMKVDLVPQGTLAERIRCAGAGLGGVLTPTGLGTEVEKGKQVIAVAGRNYLLEEPLTADYAFVFADAADRTGNAIIPKSAKNFNIVMAMAAKHTILECQKLVEPGVLDPDQIHLPGVFVNTLVERS